MTRAIFLLFCLFASLTLFAQTNTGQKFPEIALFQLRNCNMEMRTVTFSTQVQFFMYWVMGQASLEKNKTALFTHLNKEDSNYLREGILKVKNSLPKPYWKFPFGDVWYDNAPNVDSIWFMQIYAQYIKPKTIKIYAAYKIIFEGNVARVDKQREAPKIKKVEFIFDKAYLTKLERDLFKFPESK